MFDSNFWNGMPAMLIIAWIVYLSVLALHVRTPRESAAKAWVKVLGWVDGIILVALTALTLIAVF